MTPGELLNAMSAAIASKDEEILALRNQVRDLQARIREQECTFFGSEAGKHKIAADAERRFTSEVMAAVHALRADLDEAIKEMESRRPSI